MYVNAGRDIISNDENDVGHRNQNRQRKKCLFYFSHSVSIIYLIYLIHLIYLIRFDHNSPIVNYRYVLRTSSRERIRHT